MKDDVSPSSTPPWRKWLKRGGVGLFLFFLIKGLAWLIIPAVSLYLCSRG